MNILKHNVLSKYPIKLPRVGCKTVSYETSYITEGCIETPSLSQARGSVRNLPDKIIYIGLVRSIIGLYIVIT